MSQIIESLEKAQLRRVPAFQAGDRVRVHFQVVEGTRRRTQVFEGVVIRRQGNGSRETFTVRKLSFGVGVERTFPVHSPKIEKIEVAARGDVRRAKLYYLRGRTGRAARVRERRFDPTIAAELQAQEAALAEQETAPVLAGEEIEAETITPEEAEAQPDEVAATEVPEATDEIPGDAADAPEASDAAAAPDPDAPTADADPNA